MGIRGKIEFSREEKSKLIKLLESSGLLGKVDVREINRYDFSSAFLFYEFSSIPEFDKRDAHYFFNKNEIKNDPEKLNDFIKNHDIKYGVDFKFNSVLIYALETGPLEIRF